ncbi:helix-turn-helix domain-containing protein [Bradyrhizobium sp. CSA207]|uniref:helix-turn-helix transcriptional regulator n=1 Tax=Bradyrhizobium sp. CSA207 TaxID=2698826 RepID=UPI0023AF6D6D|nr:helix-turn-helix transcriptional regulator [Bradyrhizobium sp. CSA207]MDE5444408.1 helix-turn-helix domain-containing protein [Bradyrhizobium sp. CSA207]
MKRRNPAHTKRLLARNLRELRLQRSWSQYDLADEASLRQALISALELATANPTLESLDKISAALGVEVAELLLPSKKVLADRPAADAAGPASGVGAGETRHGRAKRG